MCSDSRDSAFDEREVRALESAAPESRQALFYTLWTLKESFAKALQLELGRRASSMRFLDRRRRVARTRADRCELGARRFFSRDLSIFIAAAWIGGERGRVARTVGVAAETARGLAAHCCLRRRSFRR